MLEELNESLFFGLADACLAIGDWVNGYDTAGFILGRVVVDGDVIVPYRPSRGPAIIFEA